MSKRIEVDGKFFRKRRGKLVEIPTEWVGQTTHPQNIRKRLSKGTRKLRNYLKPSGHLSRYKDARTIPMEQEEP